MFQRESDMAPVVSRWLTAAGLHVKPEFVTPWGICDFAALRFNDKHVVQRLRLKQSKHVASITSAAILLSIPEVGSSEVVTLRCLADRFSAMLTTADIQETIERLVTDRFVTRQGESLQKLNGWMPLHDRLVAVEMKRNRVEEAMTQAKRNLGFACDSYVAFPMQVAESIASSMKKWAHYFVEGIGLIGVEKSRCRIIVPVSDRRSSPDPAIQLYSVEKFWRTTRGQRQLVINDSATASGRRAVPSNGKSGSILPSA